MENLLQRSIEQLRVSRQQSLYEASKLDVRDVLSEIMYNGLIKTANTSHELIREYNELNDLGCEVCHSDDIYRGICDYCLGHAHEEQDKHLITQL